MSEAKSNRETSYSSLLLHNFGNDTGSMCGLGKK
jgi:hypothetical protein